MGNVRSGAVSLPVIYMSRQRTTEIEKLGKQANMPHASLSSRGGEKKTWKKKTNKHTHLHALVSVHPAALQQVDVEGLVNWPQWRGVLLSAESQETELDTVFQEPLFLDSDSSSRLWNTGLDFPFIEEEQSSKNIKVVPGDICLN